MKTPLAVFTLVVLACSNSAFAAPEVGDKAPDFKLQASDGKEYALADFAGKRAVVIAWFPKAFTRGCTAECKNMKENGKAIRAFDVAYFTASVDDNETNTKFAQSLGLDFPILSDSTKATAKAYGVFNPDRSVANRWTFYIGPDGVIKAIDKMVNTAEAAREMADILEQLGAPKK
jgi:peroxiredoxin Q/BCP